jgi:chromosomal replication initiation ATPase DnaA
MLKPDKDAIWKEVLNSVRVSVSTPIFNTWISQTHLDSLRKLDQKRYMAEIGCNSTFVKATVEQRYFGLLQDALIKALGSHCDMTFVIKADPTRAAQKMDLTATLFEKKIS